MNENLKKGQRASGIATVATLFLSVVKGIVGILSGSLLLIADAIHSAVDILAIFAAWFGLRLSQRKPNQRFPYGYYKAENLATLVAVGFIFYAAYEIFTRSYARLFSPSAITMPAIAIAVPLGSAALSAVIARYEEKVGKKISSQSLIANAHESYADVLSSLVVFAGILLTYLGISYVEGIIGILLSLLVIKIGIENARKAVYSLMDASPDSEIEKHIRGIILKTEGAKDVKDLRIRESGTLLFGEAVLKVTGSIDVKRGHEVSEKVEQKIKKRYPRIESFLLHIEPDKKELLKVVIPIAEDKGLDSEVMGHFGRADSFLVAQVRKKKILSWKIIKNPFKKKEVRAGLSATKQVLKAKPDVVVLKKIGEISYHTLRDGYVDLYMTKGRTAKDVLNNLMNGRLEKLKKPTHESDKKE
jgi:cation diffusion facilitator family transporter